MAGTEYSKSDMMADMMKIFGINVIEDDAARTLMDSQMLASKEKPAFADIGRGESKSVWSIIDGYGRLLAAIKEVPYIVTDTGDGVALNSVAHPRPVSGYSAGQFIIDDIFDNATDILELELEDMEPHRTKPTPAVFDYDTIRENRAVMMGQRESGTTYAALGGKKVRDHDFTYASDNCHACLMPSYLIEDDYGWTAECRGAPFGEVCVQCGLKAVHATFGGDVACWACDHESGCDRAERADASLKRHRVRIAARVAGHKDDGKKLPMAPPVPSGLADLLKQSENYLLSEKAAIAFNNAFWRDVRMSEAEFKQMFLGVPQHIGGARGGLGAYGIPKRPEREPHTNTISPAEFRARYGENAKIEPGTGRILPPTTALTRAVMARLDEAFPSPAECDPATGRVWITHSVSQTAEARAAGCSCGLCVPVA